MKRDIFEGLSTIVAVVVLASCGLGFPGPPFIPNGFHIRQEPESLRRVRDSVPFQAWDASTPIPNSDLNWSVIGTAERGTIDAAGTYTAPDIAPLGQPVVAQSRRISTGDTARFEFYVSPRLTISPAQVTVPCGGTQQFILQVEGVPPSITPNFHWMPDPVNIQLPNVGSITQTGLYTAPPCTAPVPLTDSVSVEMTNAGQLASAPGFLQVIQYATVNVTRNP